MKILIIDDDQNIRSTFRLRLSSWGYQILDAEDGEAGLRLVEENADCEAVFADLNMPGLSGLDLLQRLCTNQNRPHVVAMTGSATFDTEEQCREAGVYGFLHKPVRFGRVRSMLQHFANLRPSNSATKASSSLDPVGVRKRRLDHEIVGSSAAIMKVLELVKTVAGLECTVLIIGETGTGKEMVARSIHQASCRALQPLVTMDCGALSETLLEAELFGYEKGAFTGAAKAKRGCFELADGGTIFLDEINNAPSSVQQRLLRVLQEQTLQRVGSETTRTVDVRVIAASNKDLRELVQQGAFREDLYYRLNVVPIRLPLLRQRPSDIPLLAEHFIAQFIKRSGRNAVEISAAALAELVDYPWPGNVRELANVMERTAIMTPGPLIEHVFFDPAVSLVDGFDDGQVNLDTPLTSQIQELEKRYLHAALQANWGRVTQVAKQAGLNPRTLRRKMQQFGLNGRSYR